MPTILRSPKNHRTTADEPTPPISAPAVFIIGPAAVCGLAGVALDFFHLYSFCSPFMAGATSHQPKKIFRLDLSYPGRLEYRNYLVGIKLHPDRRCFCHPGQFPADVPSLDPIL